MANPPANMSLRPRLGGLPDIEADNADREGALQVFLARPRGGTPQPSETKGNGTTQFEALGAARARGGSTSAPPVAAPIVNLTDEDLEALNVKLPRVKSKAYNRENDTPPPLERGDYKSHDDWMKAIANQLGRSQPQPQQWTEEDQRRLDSKEPDLRHLEHGDKTVTLDRNQNEVDKERFREEQGKQAEAARRARQADFKKWLREPRSAEFNEFSNPTIDTDPESLSYKKAQLEFNRKQEKAEQDSYRAALKKEEDDLVSNITDPFEQFMARGEHRLKRRQAQSPAVRAFELNEAVQRLARVDKFARSQANVPGLAVYDETFGAFANNGANLTAMAARLTGNSAAADEILRARDERDAGRAINRQDDLSPYLSEMYGGVAGSIVQSMSIPGGPTMKGIGAGFMTANESLTEATDAGVTGGERLRYAATQGSLEMLFEVAGERIFGGGHETRMLGKAVAAKTWKQLAKNIGMDTLKELPGELLTTVFQSASSVMEGVSPDMTLGDFIQQLADTVVATVMQSGITNVPNGVQVARGTVPPDATPPVNRSNRDNLTDEDFEALNVELPRVKSKAENRENDTPPPLERGDYKSYDDYLNAIANQPTQPQKPQKQPQTKQTKQEAIAAFREDPRGSQRTYDAAVAAGMKPLPGTPNRAARAKYAERERIRIADQQALQQWLGKDEDAPPAPRQPTPQKDIPPNLPLMSGERFTPDRYVAPTKKEIAESKKNYVNVAADPEKATIEQLDRAIDFADYEINENNRIMRRGATDDARRKKLKDESHSYRRIVRRKLEDQQYAEDAPPAPQGPQKRSDKEIHSYVKTDPTKATKNELWGAVRFLTYKARAVNEKFDRGEITDEQRKAINGPLNSEAKGYLQRINKQEFAPDKDTTWDRVADKEDAQGRDTGRLVVDEDPDVAPPTPSRKQNYAQVAADPQNATREDLLDAIGFVNDRQKDNNQKAQSRAITNELRQARNKSLQREIDSYRRIVRAKSFDGKPLPETQSPPVVKQPKSQSTTEQEDVVDFFTQTVKPGEQNAQETDVVKNEQGTKGNQSPRDEGAQQGQEGRQEGVLKPEPPARTQAEDRPAAPQDAAKPVDPAKQPDSRGVEEGKTYRVVTYETNGPRTGTAFKDDYHIDFVAGKGTKVQMRLVPPRKTGSRAVRVPIVLREVGDQTGRRMWPHEATLLESGPDGKPVDPGVPLADRLPHIEDLDDAVDRGLKSSERGSSEYKDFEEAKKWLAVPENRQKYQSEFGQRGPRPKAAPKASPVATGGPSPDQSPKEAGPVSKPDAALLRESFQTKPIGRGGNATVYAVEGTDFVLRVPHSVKTIDDSFKPVKNNLPDISVGQAVFENKDGVQVLQKQNGTPAGLALPSKDPKGLPADLQEYASKIKLAASMPQSAFDGFADTLRKINESDHSFDPSKSNNVLIDQENGTFNIVDVQPNPDKKAGSGYEHMIVPLMGNTFAYRYQDAREAGTVEDLSKPLQNIFRKSERAARKAGLDMKLGSSGEWSRKFSGIGATTEAGPVSKQPWEMTRDEFVKIPLGFQLNTESEEFQQLDKKRQAELLKQQAANDTKGRAINEWVGEDLSRPPGDSVAAHRHVVKKALDEGKPVPPEVLADYPDLKPTPEPASIEPALPAEPEAKPPVKQFASLPQKSQDLFNKAFESKDVGKLKDMVLRNNLAWNKEFENRTGITLPKTLKDRYQAVTDWAASVGKPAPKAETPAKDRVAEIETEAASIADAQAQNKAESLKGPLKPATEAEKPTDIQDSDLILTEDDFVDSDPVSPEPAKPAEPSAPVQFKEISKALNAAGIERTLMVESGPRTLLLELHKKADVWSIRETPSKIQPGKVKQPKQGKQLAFGMRDFGKAKDVARRIVAGTFSEEGDLKFQKTDTENIGLSDSRFGKEIKDARLRSRLAASLRETNIATDGSLLIKVSDKSRDAILKAIGPTEPDKAIPVGSFITKGNAAVESGDAEALTIVGYRGGDIEPRTVALRNKAGEITVVDKAYFDTAMNRYPNSAIYLAHGDQVLFVTDGEVNALLMVMDIKNADHHLKMLQKGDYPFPKNLPAPKPASPPKAEKPPKAQKQENKPTEEQSQEDMMEEILREELLGEAPAKPAEISEADARRTTEAETAPTPTTTRTAEPPAKVLVESLEDELLKSRGIDAKKLWALADKAYGGTRAEGKYGPSEAYDALETAINLTILDARAMGLKTPAGQVSPETALKNLLDMQKQIVSQTNRSGTKDTMQQFSTPPAYSYVVSQFANIDARDVVLEPSAGTGDLAVHALNQRAKVHVNELDPGRAEMLKAVQESSGDRMTISTEDALQLGNIMGPNLQPSVVLMNPPFSREGQRMGDKKMSGNDRNHIDAALGSLIDGGRLVAIIGAGLHGPSKGFTTWLAETAKKHNVRANIEVSRDVYKGYGTTFPTRVLVIDKGTPTPKDGTVTAQADSLEHLLTMTKGIRNDRNRPTIQPVAPGPNVPGNADKTEGGQQPETSGRPGTDASSSGKPHGNTSGRPAKAPRRPSGTGNTNAADDAGGRPDADDSKGTGRNKPAGSKSAGGRTTDAAGEPTGNLAGQSPEQGRLGDAKKKSAETAAALKVAEDDVFKAFGSTMNTGLNPEQMRATARLVRAALNHQVSTFNEFVAYVVDKFGEPMALRMAEGIELAWKTLKRLPEYSGVDAAGKVAEVVDALGKEKQEPGEKKAEKQKRTEIDESVLYESYQPSIVPFSNALPHPTSAVESAAMSAVDYPAVTEVPNIDPSIIKDGRLSDIQLEFIALAAHAHNQMLPSDERTGILFGDGTGMGKGRGIPGVILHNWNEGRKQAIWMSKNGKLHTDAMAEWAELGGNPAQIANLSDMAVDDDIDLKEGILFATYDTLKSRGKTGKTRESQVTDWLPKDFDGVIAFDEAHLMGSDTAARAGVARQLQDKFPKARVVYASATAATEIDQLVFASRLGLWGPATPFATAQEFAAKIGSAGVAAMESVALSLKAMGRYVSRSISFNDGTPDGTVGYKRLNHPLADHQIQMYDRLAGAWQNVISEFESALDDTGADNMARGFARGQFWSAHQRFFNDLVTSLQMPTVIDAIEKDLAEGRSVVIQLTSTGAAQTTRALAGRGTQSLDDFSVDPFSALVELVRTQFPTQAYEDYVKDDGSVGKRPVLDSAGKPVKDADAVAQQQQLLSDLAEMESAMPDGPLDMILNHFGIENVAEVTSRNQRVVWQEQQDGTKKRVLEKRNQKKSGQADIDAFQEGKKRILIFSQAGGTGASYHADRRVSNQQKRMHYLVQPGWIAANAIQGLGRTHRTNQRQAPEYILVQTDIPGQKRFISTIARRLTQLGALTRGQRTAGGSGVFDASDNLESTEASLALTEFYKSLENEDAVMSLDEFEEQTGLELRLRSTGAMKSDVNLPDITQFMNRMLSMKIDSQNKVFDEFDRMLKNITEARRISGQLDQGVETLKGSNVKKTRDEVVYTHGSGAKTRYVQLTMDVPVPSRDFEEQSKQERYKDFVGYYKRKSDGRVFFVNESFAKTTKSGLVVDMIRLVPPYGESLREEAHTLNDKRLDKIPRGEAESLWNEQFGKRPKTKSQKVDMITGAVLPVWDRLPQLQPKLSRALTADGDMVLGVVLPPSQVNETLGKLGAEKNKVDTGATVKMLRAGKGDVQLVNGWTIQRARVQNEWRLEILGPNPVNEMVFQRQGVIIERIGFKARYFIPFGENTQTVFDAVTRGNPIQKVNNYDGVDSDDDQKTPAETPDPAEQDEDEEAPETERQKSANEARAAVEAQKAENARLNAVIVREFQKGDQSHGAFGVISDELARAIGQRIAGQIKLEFKQFDLFIKDLRASGTIDDAIIRGIKDNLIGGWNAGRERFGLDTATDASFEDSMSDTVDVDIEQIVEAAKAVTPETSPQTPPELPRTPPEVPKKSPPVPRRPDKSRTIPEQSPDDDDDGPTISIKKAKRAERLNELGLDQEDIVNKVGHSFPELDAEAKRVSPGEAEDVFARIGEGGEAADNASDRDVFVMLNHYAQKQMATRKTQDDLEAARAAGDDFKVVELQAKLSAQVAEEARLMAIAKNAGTASGRALAAFKAVLQYDMSLARLRMRLDDAADGKPTSAQTKAQIELHAKYEAAVKDLEAKTKEAEENLTRALIAEQIANDMQAKTKPPKTKADKRLAAAWKPFQKANTFFSVTGAFQMLPEFTELAGAHIEKGVETFDAFVEKLSKHFGRKPKPETLPVLQQAWDTASDIAKNPTPSAPPKVSIEPDHPESVVKAAKALFRHFLSEGITNTDEVIDAVHEELQNQFPDEIGERLDTMKAMVDYDKTRTLSQDPLDILAADKRAVVQMKVHLENMERGIAANRIEQRYPVTDEQREHRKQVNEAKRRGGFVVTDPERQATSALASIETGLRHAISDTLNEIANPGRTVPNKTVSPTSDTIEDLKSYLALVHGMHKTIFGTKTMTPEQRLKAAEAAAVKSEAYWNDRLSKASQGDFTTGSPKQAAISNANIDAIKARAAFAKAQVQFLKTLANPKPDPEAISDARYLVSLQKQLVTKLARMADITARAAAGDFNPERNLSKEKKEANAKRRKADASIRDARIKLDETTRDLNEQIEQTRLSNLTYVDLAKRVPGGVISLVRDMAFGGELSFILKQGAPHVFGTLAPAGKIARAGYEAITGNTAAAKVKLRQARQGYGKLGRALAGSLKAFLWKTDTELARSQDAIKQRPGYKNGMYKAMGVPVEDGGTLTVKEEVFLTNLFETGGLALDKMFPGFKGFRDGRPVFTQYAHNLNVANRFSNATKVFMSTIRADIADNAAEVWTMKRGEMTPAEARSLGRIANIVTGKGDMKSIGMDNEQALGFLGRLFISAPWLKSRFDMLMDPVLSLNPWSSRRTLESRKIAAEIYVDAAAGVAAYYGAVVLAAMFYNDDDDEKPVVEWDSTSGDFMKPRWGKTRIDPLFGLQQVIVMGSRMYHGTYKDHRGDIQKREGNSDLFGLAGQFFKGRLHPWIQAGVAIYTQEDFNGQPITTAEVLKRMPIPVTYPDIVEASKNRGIPASTAFGLWGYIGGGLQTNQPRTKDRRDIADELRYVQRKIDNPNTPADMRKSLQADADTMLEAHLVNAVKNQANNDGNKALAEQATNHKPGTPLFPELTEAIQKEKYDIIMNASARVSSDRRFKSNDEKLEFSGDDDKGRNIARSLIPLMIPNVDEAIKLYDDAYIKANKTLTEPKKGVEGNTIKVIKPSVAAGRYRIKQLYLQQ